MDISKFKILKPFGNDKYDYLFKILIVGNSGVGKSSLLSRFSCNEFKIDSKATIGVEFSTKLIQVDDKIIKAQIWDTAGQERFRAIVSSFYRSGVGCLMCFDLTNNNSYSEVDKWLDEILKFSNSCDITFGEKSTIVLVGNKSDLRHLRSITAENAQMLVERRGLADYIETSAYDTTNVEEAFLRVIALAYQGHLEKQKNQENSSVSPADRDAASRNRSSVVNLKNKITKSNSNCC